MEAINIFPSVYIMKNEHNINRNVGFHVLFVTHYYFEVAKLTSSESLVQYVCKNVAAPT